MGTESLGEFDKNVEISSEGLKCYYKSLRKKSFMYNPSGIIDQINSKQVKNLLYK